MWATIFGKGLISSGEPAEVRIVGEEHLQEDDLFCLVTSAASIALHSVALENGFPTTVTLFEDLCVRANVDHYCGQKLLDKIARFESIHRPTQSEVHQNQIRPKLKRQSHCFLTGICQSKHRIAKHGYCLTKVLSDEGIILHDQNTSFLQSSLPTV